MNTVKIEEFFYSRASKRIKERVDISGLTHAEIYPPDSKQISRIINNKRTKNNRFLICDAVIYSSCKNDETGKQIPCGLLATKELKFYTVKEILWGTTSEINNYMYDLFETLWDEISSSNFKTRNKTFDFDSETYLCDYVPYAKYSTYYNILFNSPNTYPALFYGIKEDTIIENLEHSKKESLLFLYQKYKSKFLSLFKKFIKRHDSFHKLDKKISNDLLPSFIKMLESRKPTETSLGIRVRNLITADLTYSAPIIATGNFDFYRTSLIKASSDYILSLEQIQKRLLLLKKGNGTD